MFKKLTNLRIEYDKVVNELKIVCENLNKTEQKLNILNNEKLKGFSHSSEDNDLISNLSQQLEILEKEILLLQEENSIIKTAHDRLIEKFVFLM